MGPAAAANTPSRRKVALYLALLTLQYGAQPLISKRFVRKSEPIPEVNNEPVKVVVADNLNDVVFKSGKHGIHLHPIFIQHGIQLVAVDMERRNWR